MTCLYPLLVPLTQKGEWLEELQLHRHMSQVLCWRGTRCTHALHLSFQERAARGWGVGWGGGVPNNTIDMQAENATVLPKMGRHRQTQSRVESATANLGTPDLECTCFQTSDRGRAPSREKAHKTLQTISRCLSRSGVC